jgi:type II secretory ATPase GspE/PulE/Tfp pilus assembly ATPase PilB-like protein
MKLEDRWLPSHRRPEAALSGAEQALVADRPTPGAGPAIHGIRPASLDELRGFLQASPPSQQLAPHLGEALLGSGLIDRETLERALREQKLLLKHQPLGRILVDSGALSEVQLHVALAEWLGVRVIDAADLVPDPRALGLVPRAQAERDGVLPLMLDGDDGLVVLVADPWDHALLDQLRFATQRRMTALMAQPGTLWPSIHRAYGASRSERRAPAAAVTTTDNVHEIAAQLRQAPPMPDLPDAEAAAASENALVRLINSMIREAIARRASDIHIETGEPPNEVRVRLRIDGDLVPFIDLPPALRFAIVSRIKIMADLDISEHRKPQDGKIDFSRFGGAHTELRVVTVPTSHGLEDVVLRLLSGLRPMPLEDIGLSAANLRDLRAVVGKPYGLILICGPTGCGKTTTLHSVMRDINTGTRKIWTAEDPIEITQEGLRQVQMNPRIGWTFAAAMRTFLRADPDVIMIGEMRDEETARIAIEASLTGHLVLSTLHTNSAPESIARLLEIGLDPFNFSDSLLAILAQRLVRRLCNHCKQAVVAGEEELDALAARYLASGVRLTPDDEAREREALKRRWRDEHGDAHGSVRLYRSAGCDACAGRGFLGRLGIHELMLADDAARRHIRQRQDAGVLQADALAAGMKTLRQDGIDKVLQGLTDLNEVVAATNN